ITSSYKLSSKQEITQIEDKFFKGGKSETEKEAKTAPKRDLNIITELEPIVTTLSKKVMLELLECGTTNYSTNKVQKQIIDQGLKQTEEIEEFIKNRHKEVIVKEAIDSLIQDEENPIMISFGPDSRSLKKSPNKINSKEENLYSSIWASKSEEVQANRIRCCLNFYRKATIVRTQEHGKTKAVYVQLTSRATSRIEAFKRHGQFSSKKKN
ncbi:45513_t:CDS:2, partial [Gigaspora margarita]